MPPVLRRTVTLAVVVIVFLVLVGTTYQGVATALERRQYPHPGSKIKAGRHQLHIYCTGDGPGPTVVLEAAATGMSAAWGWVQPALAEDMRVCSYDRAGLGWSEWGSTTFDPAAVPEQLHALLANAGEKRPYVLVGQGFGAALARMTAARYPDEVTGLLLIDPPASATEATDLRRMARRATVSPWLARTGMLRVTRALSRSTSDMPEPARGMLDTFLARPDHLTRSALELAQWNDTLALAEGMAVPASIKQAAVTIAGTDRTAMLTDRADAAKAIDAIRSLVEEVK